MCSIRSALAALAFLGLLCNALAQSTPPPQDAALGSYLVLGWNDLGMHCMTKDYSAITVLPPYNDLWAQVIRRGAPPQITTQSITLTYRFPANTYSAGKINFWTYSNALFGVNTPDVGLTGLGLTGNLSVTGSAFEAVGVPLTPYEDAAPTVEQPYQYAEVTALMGSTPLDVTTFVAPTSTEMHCDLCHGSTNTYNSILALHDNENGTNLRNSKPVLCANCHSSNALGKPGQAGLPSLSRAMHAKHSEEAPNTSCYSCHPGQQTQCLRGAMYLKGKTCTDCHGTLSQVASSISAGRRPWLDEPKCSQCHDSNHSENTGKLYRNSTGHGGLYCTACHNSPHAELPTAQPRDAVQAMRVQGTSSYIGKQCTVCHTTMPTQPGPHGYLPAGVATWQTYGP